MESRIVRTAVVDPEGVVIGFKSEKCNWAPTKIIRDSSTSESTRTIRNIKVGETLRVFHGDLTCSTKDGMRKCSLLPQLTKLRQQGWKIEQYHEKDHVIVVRRLA